MDVRDHTVVCQEQPSNLDGVTESQPAYIQDETDESMSLAMKDAGASKKGT